jgi:tetratricopeptide (TPR) repeat protein
MKTIACITLATALVGCKAKEPTSSAPKVAEPAATTASDYDAHVRAGESLETAGKWPEALAEFEAAVTANPGDAKALTEVGWTAYHANKLARAKEASLAAATAAKTPSLRGSALFNLGLAIEADDPHAAASLYMASYKLRPNQDVSQRLVKVEHDPKTATAKPEGKQLLGQLKVEELVAPGKRRDYAAPIDDALIDSLIAGGLHFEMGAGHGGLVAQGLVCEETGKAEPHAYSCKATGADSTGTLAATGDAAREIAVNLIARKVAGTTSGDKTTYKTDVRCETHDVEGPDDRIPPDECEIGAN